MSNKKHYYVSGHTSKGLVNFLITNIRGIKKVIVLKHRSYILKTKILRKVISDYESTEELEVICSAFGTSFIDGVIMKGKSLAIITDSIADSALADTIKVDLTNYFPDQLDQKIKQEKNSQIEKFNQKAYDLFLKGLHIHDELEEIYIKEMDFQQADQLTEKFIKGLLKDVPKQKQSPTVKNRFFGTNTAEGAVNILPKIIKSFSKRIYVKGRAGTGKSVFMKKIATACMNHGFDVERYHCSFDPSSIDMIVVSALDICIFDSTNPHEFFPERAGDIVIDLYERAVTQGTDEKYSKEIQKLTIAYQTKLKEGMDYLKRAKKSQDQLDKLHVVIDQKQINESIKHIYSYI